MKISSGTVNVEPQFALNPQVLPFYPRSLLSNSCFIKAADSVGNNDVYGDFARSLEQFCGISNDTAHSSTADDKLHVSRTDSWESWGMPSDFSTSICEPSSASVDAIWKETSTARSSLSATDWVVKPDSKRSTDDGDHLKSRSSPTYNKLPGSKLLDGTWLHSADSGCSVFELFRGVDVARADTSLDANEHNDTKYYTPFGSGISLGDLTRCQLPNESCWNTEPSESPNGVIGKPFPTMSTVNKTTAAVTKPSDMVITSASKQLEEWYVASITGRGVEQPRRNRNTDKAVTGSHTNSGQQREAVGCQSLSSGVSDYHAVQTPSPKLMGNLSDGNCVAAENQEKQLIASQQMFMHELNRLPPDLRKHYVDYMIARHLGLLHGACPTVPAVPAMYYSVAVGPSTVPVTQMFAHPVIMPTGPLMPTPLITLQPLVPAPANKSVNRRTEAANELHVALEECHEQFRMLENERKKTEAELARQNPGKSVSSDNSRSLPPLPTNPSRVDRLVVDSLREHAKVTTLVERIQQLCNVKLTSTVCDTFTSWADATHRVDARRRDEIANAINRHRTKNVSQKEKDKDVSALAAALGCLTSDLRRARTMLWCCLYLGSCDMPSSCINAARLAAKQNIPLCHYCPPVTAQCHMPLFGPDDKPLASEAGTNDDADIWGDDDDSVFTYTGELVESCGLQQK